MRKGSFGRGDDTVGNHHRAQVSQFEFFELILLLKYDKQFPVGQFEATVSQSTVPSPPLMVVCFLQTRVPRLAASTSPTAFSSPPYSPRSPPLRPLLCFICLYFDLRVSISKKEVSNCSQDLHGPFPSETGRWLLAEERIVRDMMCCSISARSIEVLPLSSN